MASNAAMIPMHELMAAAVTPEDLDFELDPDSANTMNEFQIAWKKFMKDHPELIPEGKREKNIKQLQKKAMELKKTQAEANDELQKQLDFFEKSRETLELNTKKELEEARTKQQKAHDKLQKQLDSITASEHLLSQTYPWDFFVASVDAATGKSGVKHDLGADSAKTVKPSDRALYLVDSTKGHPKNIELRAYQIDHALLNTQIRMLQNEAKALERILETQESLSMFLAEYGSSKSIIATSNTSRVSAAS